MRLNQVLFSLLRSAICGIKIKEEISSELLTKAIAVSKQHDIVHLISYALDKNGLAENDKAIKAEMLKAIYRQEHLSYEYEELCATLEAAQIPFIPLKGSILRTMYPEPWMRTSCDIDVLVHKEDLEKAISYLVTKLNYTEMGRATHDASLYTQYGAHIELHFDLVEEERANSANEVLNTVWENVSLKENCNYQYKMSDEFFYFYHIAHMAKHFETGGCGIRPFIDLWILDNIKNADINKRNELLEQGNLLKFAEVSRRLSRVWLDGEKPDAVTEKMQNYLLEGGVYGSSENRVALNQQSKGGKIGYLFSRIFIPFSKLKRYYPVLEKHAYLAPIMQVRRWFMLLNPNVLQMAKNEIAANNKIEQDKANDMKKFLENVGL